MRARDYLRTALWSWDCAVGVGVGAFALLLAISPDVRGNGITILLAELAVGVAIMGTVLAALAIFAACFDGSYRRVLEAAGGLKSAMAPYMVVAVVAALSSIAALLAALGWPAFGPWARGPALGIASLLCGWTVAGVVSLVELTIFHAGQRAKLMRGAEEADQIRAGRLGGRQLN